MATPEDLGGRNPLELENIALTERVAALEARNALLQGEIRNEIGRAAVELRQAGESIANVADRLERLVGMLGEQAVVAPQPAPDNPVDDGSQGSRTQDDDQADAPSATGGGTFLPPTPGPFASRDRAANNSSSRENWFKRKSRKIGAVVVAAAIGAGIGFAVGKLTDDKDKTPNVLSGTIPAKYTDKKPSNPGGSGDKAKPGLPSDKSGDKPTFPSGNALRGASLNEAAKLIKSGSVADAKANVRKIAESPEIRVSHSYNQQAHAAVNKEAITLPTAIEMVALSRHSDDGNVVTTYNNLHDRPLTSELPTSVSEARAWILNKMADEGTNYRLLKMSIPNSENAAQRSEHDVFSVRQNFSNVLFLEMTLENGKKALFKVGGGSDQSIGTCWNDVQGNPVSVREFVGSTISTSQGQRTSTTNTTGGGGKVKPQPDKPDKTSNTNQTGGKRIVKLTPKTDEGSPGTGDSPVQADRGKGNPTGVQEKTEPTAGPTPDSVARPPAPQPPAPQRPSSEGQNRPPAETGNQGGNGVPEAPVPGTSNGEGQGGPTDPNAMFALPLALGGALRARRGKNGKWNISNASNGENQ